MIVKIKTRVKPTEDKEKVVKAVRNIFRDAEIQIEEDNILTGKTKSLKKLKEMIRRQAILDAARMILEKGISENSTRFVLNKQAAYCGVVNFDRDVHGGIDVKVIAEEGEDIRAIVKDIAPRTKDGKIVKEEEILEEDNFPLQ
ncbi:MAG TPA: hypothetical protein EYH15_03120 [Methanothermococcus okinawensis]|uniref:UPF0201 protein EYH15_03120 n=1 Tax=Methanothermococcus okinawensis TaxID=155863 RepID=A0A832ZKW2_9EURY|nr:hypothetical protein [Methanococcaceae archaeon]HIP84460.1 hypothetical protein [Methanothermococcus okinawensis]HIP90726.1 hypothetical protein [Methanothermococcus okinawensis]